MINRKHILLAGLLFCFGFAKSQNKVSDTLAVSGGGTAFLSISTLGKSTIYLKDKSQLLHCIIKEVHAYWIVYQKNLVLHDMMKERIRCIETEDGRYIISFDEKGNAKLTNYCPR